MLVGAPHPNEPIGTLTIDFLCASLLRGRRSSRALDVTLYVVPVRRSRRLVLNEGWFRGEFSPLRYARQLYRPPHREQVEWSFPVYYKTLRFATPARKRDGHAHHGARAADVFYSLHNAGFCGVYFYVSHDRPRLYPAFYAAGRRHRGCRSTAASRKCRTSACSAPAVYELFGIGETYEYMATALGGRILRP